MAEETRTAESSEEESADPSQSSSVQLVNKRESGPLQNQVRARVKYIHN